ncbi:PREDICTED: granzyme A-like [Chrysochloris asiatica]|uniref:Granzyme A-like n=1 Tax=Chrysochloris asiatica TaxID=185453 RepID=A0A9B0X0H4_CHRAS|nr:PREDICTED: granzyme A-like [Chrysochloris asiatica]
MKIPPAALFLLLIPGVFSEPLVGIIGGHEVAPHSRRYMTLLKGTEVCAGALIKENWVLTAAHCQIKRSTQIILGAHSIGHNEKFKQIFSFNKTFTYPCNDPQTHEGDLQLIQLKGRATINKAVGLLPLPKTGEDVKPNTKCHVAGWGSTKTDPCGVSDTLREVNVTVIDRKICNGAKYYNFQPIISNDMICAGDKKGESDSCKGDSGSPLICDNIFRGVTSFGKCGDPKKPGVYILLTNKHLNWIRKTIGGAM